MGWFVAFAAGYFVGARAGREEFDELTRAFRAVVTSEEVADLAHAARSHAGHTLRELAAVIDGSASADGFGDDLVERVKGFFVKD
jgi:hypothetical protein